jgi:hypothetical protein
MHRLATLIAKVILTGSLLLSVFAAVAALDEFARIPFYRTLPVAAGLINSAWLLMFARRTRRMRFGMGLVARLAQSASRLFTFPRLAFSRTWHNRRTRTTAPGDRKAPNTPSVEEIEAALRKVHSIAWGFPLRIRSVRKEERLNDEVFQ